MIYKTEYLSPLGKLSLASDGKNLTGLWFVGQKYFPPDFNNYIERVSLPVFKQTFEWLDIYFLGGQPLPLPPVNFESFSFFRQCVFNLLLKIHYGQVISYKDIVLGLKREYGISSCARAVGSAVGHNPVSIIVPCHRVVSADGRLSGYAGGTDKKLALLKLEGDNINNFKL